MAKKRFHKSDSLVYQYNMVEFPTDSEDLIFTREICLIYAAKGVKWQDVVKEIHDLCGTAQPSALPSNPGPTLRTVMVDYPDFVVALTLSGAVKIIEALIEAQRLPWVPHPYKYFKQVDDFAKEMVANRDRAEWEKSLPEGKHAYRPNADFWPKD